MRGAPKKRPGNEKAQKTLVPPPLSLGAFAIGRGRAFGKIYKNKTL